MRSRHFEGPSVRWCGSEFQRVFGLVDGRQKLREGTGAFKLPQLGFRGSTQHAFKLQALENARI